MYAMVFQLCWKTMYDASWISSVNENKSTLAGGAISWASKKQTSIFYFTMTCEYIALVVAAKEAEWLWNMLLLIRRKYVATTYANYFHTLPKWDSDA